MSLFPTKCERCGSTEHSTQQCPHEFFTSHCLHCGSVDHPSADCQFGKCSYCGSREHPTNKCPHSRFASKCGICGSLEHATENCPHDLYTYTCERCGSKNHSTRQCPHRSSGIKTKPAATSNSVEEQVIGFIFQALAIIVLAWLVLWFVAAIALPLLIINISVIALLYWLIDDDHPQIPLAVSILAAIYVVFDYNLGWTMAFLVDNVSFFKGALPYFYVINLVTGLIASYLIVRNHIELNLPNQLVSLPDNTRNELHIGSLIAIAGLVCGIQFSSPKPNYASPIASSRNATNIRTSVTPRATNTIESNRALASIPINNLFKAWSRLNLDLYMAQWHPDAAQYSKKYAPRAYADILQRRTSLFARLSSVEVLKQNFLSRNMESNVRATMDVQYTMVFHFKDGRKVSETDVMERYIVEYSVSEGRWMIVSNYDYIN